jgi:signal transduction histidine kinase
MSKKDIHNQLNNLFAELQSESQVEDTQLLPEKVTGWTWECNQDLRYTSCSSEIFEVLGYQADELINQSIYEFALTSESRQKFKTSLNSSEYPQEIDLTFVDKTGHYFGIRMTIMQNGNQGYRGFTQIISEELSVKPRAIGKDKDIHNGLVTLISDLEETQKVKVNEADTLGETKPLTTTTSLIDSARSFHEILEILCNHTFLGKADINTTIDLFDQPWRIDQKPEWILVVSRKRNVNSDRVIPCKYPLSLFQSPSEYLKPDVPTIIMDVKNDPRLDDYGRSIFVEILQANGAIFLPLQVGDCWIGYVNAIFAQAIHVSDSEMRKAETFVKQAALAIQNSRLISLSEHCANQLQISAEIIRDISGIVEPDILLPRCTTLVRERFGFYNTSIFMLDDEKSIAVLRDSTGKSGDEMKRAGIKHAVGSKSIVGTVAKNGKSLVINDINNTLSHEQNSLLPYTRSELGLPMKIGQEVIGVLDVHSTEVNAFSFDDIAILQSLTDHIALIIRNAQAFEISQRAITEMQKAYQFRSEFLLNMGHELRTPLNSIIGFARVILKGIDGPITELQKQDLTAIHNSSQHLLNLINDILDLSKIEAGKMELTLENQVDLADLIHSVLPTVNGLIKGRSISLQPEISPTLPKVTVDPGKIRQVLLNLLSISIRLINEGAISIFADTELAETNQDQVIIKIISSGAGITYEEQANMLQLFTQARDINSQITGADGLSIINTRYLVELHTGHLSMSDEPGKSITFYFTLPLDHPHKK